MVGVLVLSLCLPVSAAIVIMLSTVMEESRTLRIPVLMYHAVVDSGDQRGRYSVSVDEFRQHLEHLKAEGYTSIKDQDLLAIREESRPCPQKPIILTFDDGRPEHHRIVYPLLKEYGFHGVFFVITGRIGQMNSLTDEELIEMRDAGMSIQSHSHSSLHLDTLAPSQRQHEIAASSRTLESLLQKPCTSFCLPGGWYDASVLKDIQDESYKLIFSSDIGTTPIETSSALVRRIEVRGNRGFRHFRGFESPWAIAWRRLVRKGKLLLHKLRGRPSSLLTPSCAANSAVSRACLDPPSTMQEGGIGEAELVAEKLQVLHEDPTGNVVADGYACGEHANDPQITNVNPCSPKRSTDVKAGGDEGNAAE